MGDRNNPIKFGPEWLRNLAHERSAGASAAGNQSAEASGSSASSGATGHLGAAAASTSTAAANTANTANTQPKVQLAKLRYGKEEMLALFDRTSEAPTELKYIELLYHPRAKPPVALYNAFEVERRESSRPGTSVGGVPPAERFGIGRGIGRGVGANVEGRGRGRLQFFRQQATGRGVAWHPGNTKLPGYSGGADEESTSAARSWNNNNVGNMAAAVRNPSDPSEWAQNKMYRSKRPGSTMNWRQSTRDDGEEWRSPEACSRSRSSLQDKWERDWGERPNQEKLQSWSSNRRTWVGGDSQNDDNLPEWAVDSAEAGAGSFDSSGAFHGYSNDDTNLPKTQETSYPLTRSHTHGSFVRSKTAEEGSDEWWASDKAKKLSPKRFDASDIKFKTPTNVHDGNSNSSANLKLPGNREEDLHTFENPELAGAAGGAAAALPEPPETSTLEEAFNKKHVRFAESKTFDALMRSDINMEEANDERGNFQSVMITPNNSLRQKHQNMMSSIDNTSTMPRRASGMVHILNNMMPTGRDHSNQQQTPESSLIDKTMDLALEDKAIQTNLANASGGSGSMINPSSLGMSSVMSNAVNSMAQIPTPSMQLTMSNPILQNQGLTATSKNNMPTVGIQGPGIQNVGVTNSALNASLGLPLGPSSNPLGPPLGMPLQGIPPPMLPLPNHGMNNHGMGGAGMQTGPGFPSSGGMPGFPPSGGMPGMSSSNVANNSLFIGQHPNNSGDIPMPNHGNQPNMYPMHGLQHSGPPGGFGSSVYGNIRQQPATPAPNVQSVADLWYYEDPKKDIQGPFSSKEMYSWYRAGFFSASLMVRRACDAIMRPLGSYGPVVPFAQLEMMYPMSSGFESRNQGTHDSMLNPQQGLGLDPMNMSNLTDANAMDSSMPYGLMRNPPYGQQQPMDTLWSRPSPPDLMWMHDAISAQRNDPRVNNFPMYFWDRQFGELYMLQLIRPEGDATEPSDIGPNPLLPEDLKKEMKTEDQILAQLRASQTIGSPQNMHFLNEPPPLIMPPSNKPTESYPTNMSLAQDLKELQNLQHLQKMIQEDSLNDIPLPEMLLDNQELKQIPLPPTIIKKEEIAPELIISKPHSQTSNKATAETKAVKQTKIDAEKSAKNKDNNNTKTKTKKAKEEKKEELTETTARVEDASKPEKRSEEPSPSKGKKDDKLNKKDLEKEKKEWIKEGFTVVKGAEKIGTKEKKKQEELKAFEEAERKRQEEEKLAIEEDRKKKLAEVLKKQQEIHHQQQQQRQAYDLIGKRAPWSAVSNHAMQATNKDGLTLAEIQRLEREKKLEQMREQQHMMQLIAQQQAAAMAREQEVQAGLGWAKKKTATNAPEQSMTEIQAEARKQAATAAAAATAAMHAFEEIQAPPPPVNLVPWGTPSNGGGFWDTPAVQQPKPQPSPKAPEPVKPKKKLALNMPAKKDPVPAAEFEAWCTTVLTSWSAKIDVPTFVGFLKDIESPYEVKDYVKCYLGETKDSNDFARQFLERRSKLLRVGMVTPSDDLCSPAIAINPRNSSGSDYQEGKGKKNKKNKMLKVDARILGFSVTAAEDRINVGDIDQTGV